MCHLFLLRNYNRYTLVLLMIVTIISKVILCANTVSHSGGFLLGCMFDCCSLVLRDSLPKLHVNISALLADRQQSRVRSHWKELLPWVEKHCLKTNEKSMGGKGILHELWIRTFVHMFIYRKVCEKERIYVGQNYLTLTWYWECATIKSYIASSLYLSYLSDVTLTHGRYSAAIFPMWSLHLLI